MYHAMNIIVMWRLQLQNNGGTLKLSLNYCLIMEYKVFECTMYHKLFLKV